MNKYTPAMLSYKACVPVTGEDGRLAPIVFVHGLTASALHWAEIPQQIANKTRRKAYVLDARNHGDSEWTDDFSFEIVAKDLLHFLDVQNIKKAIFVGHSMGGIASMILALSQPEKVEKLVIEDIVLRKVPKESTHLIIGFMKLLQTSLHSIHDGASEEEAHRIVKNYVEANIEKTESTVKVVDGHTLCLRMGEDGRYNFKSNFKVLRKFVERLASDEEWNPPKETYDGEALFIYGSDSHVQVGDHKENVKRNFPTAKFFEIEGAAHSVHRDKPAEFTDEVLRFLL